MPLSKVFQPSRGSLMSWVQQPLVSMLMRGNAYGLKSGLDSQLGGITRNIEWLHPDKVKLIDGRWTYLGRVVDDADMLHIPGLSVPGSRLGVSPLTMCRRSMTAGADSEKVHVDVARQPRATFDALQERGARCQPSRRWLSRSG